MTLLSVDDFRLFVSTPLEDDALQILLDSAEQAITRELGGPVGSVTEVVDGALRFITTRRRIDTIASVTESRYQVPTLLATDDYRMRYDRRSLERSPYGTNAYTHWGELITVVYSPEDDEADRKRVQKELVELDLNYAPGSTSEQIGAWMEQHQQSSVWNYDAERKAILATLWSDGIDFA